jgi:oligosaccharide repeat unit polymerase
MKIWKININSETLWLVVFCNVFLMIGSFIIYYFHKKYSIEHNIIRCGVLKISTIRLKLIFLFQIFVYAFTIYFLSRYYGMGSLAANLVAHTEELKFGDDAMKLPFGFSFLNTTISIMGYFFAFLIPYYIQQNNQRKIKFWLYMNFLLWLVGSLLSSGRSSLWHMIVTYIVLLFVFKRVKNKKINIKLLTRWAIFAILFLLIFQQLGFLIGRKNNDNETFSQVASVYLGAEIQNLNDFIISPRIENNDKFGVATFRPFYDEYKRFLGKYKFDKNSDLFQFNERNGYDLGNVASAIQPYYYDFGPYGAIFLCFIIGLFMQIIYCKALRSSSWSTGRITLPVFIFTVCASTMLMSFFSECFIGRIIMFTNWRFWAAGCFCYYLIYGNMPWTKIMKI